MSATTNSSYLREQLRQVKRVFDWSVHPWLDQIYAAVREAEARRHLLDGCSTSEEPPTTLTYAVMRVIALLKTTERLRAATRNYHAPGQSTGRTITSTPHITRGPNTRRSISNHRSPTGLARD